MSYVALAVTVGGALYQGMEANQAGEIANIYAQSQARMDEAAALETSQIIRKAGRRQISSANVAYAGSGVKLGEGSAQEVQNEMYAGVEHDAYQAILEGKNRAYSARQSGAQALQAGQDAQNASIINAAGSALGGYNSAKRAGGWGTQTTNAKPQATYPKG